MTGAGRGCARRIAGLRVDPEAARDPGAASGRGGPESRGWGSRGGVPYLIGGARFPQAMIVPMLSGEACTFT